MTSTIGILLWSLVAIFGAGACASAVPPAHPASQEWQLDGDKHAGLDGDWDASEKRWREEIAAQRWKNDDDDLRKLVEGDADGSVTLKRDRDDDKGTDAQAEEPKSEAPPTTFWGKVKAGADTFGRASFAAMTVVVTLGMMVAPYLLL